MSSVVDAFVASEVIIIFLARLGQRTSVLLLLLWLHLADTVDLLHDQSVAVEVG